MAMTKSYPQQRVIGPDGQEFTTLVKRVERTMGVVDGNSYHSLGAHEVGSVKKDGKVLIVARETLFLGRAPWSPWQVHKEAEVVRAEKAPAPPYAEGVISKAKEILGEQLDRRDDYGKRYGHSITDLSHMLDGHLFGWEDARVWKVVVKGPFSRAQVDHFIIGKLWDPPEVRMALPQAMLKGGAKEAIRLAGFALRELAREGRAESCGSFWYWKEA